MQNVDLFYLGYLGPINPSIGTIPTNKMISDLHSIRKSDLIYVNVRLDKMVPIIYLIHICAAFDTIYQLIIMKKLNVHKILEIQLYLQPDQMNVVVLFWYLVKGDASVRNCTVAFTWEQSRLQCTKTTLPCITGH